MTLAVRLVLLWHIAALGVTPSVGADVRLPECDVPCHWDSGHNALDCQSCSCHAIPAQGSLPTGTRDLLLPFNFIRQLPQELQLDGIIKLDLSHNDLSAIPRHAFRSMGKLEQLYLSFNNITEITHDHLYGLGQLRQLNLDGNHVTRLMDGVFYPNMHSTLQHLDFSHNDLQELDHNALTDLRVLQYLNLDANRLSSLDPQHFAGLQQLKLLKLNFNPLHVVKNDTFTSLHELMDLELEHAQLEELHEHAFRGLIKLDQLTLAGNELKQIQDRLTDLGSLRFLNLDSNPITHVTTSTFPPALTQVMITRCPQLRTVEPSAFKGLLKLQTVQISHNPVLGYIAPNAFEAAVNIRDLVLNDNALQTLAEGLVTWSLLQRLDLDGNLWRCDCRIKWMGDLDILKLASQNLTCNAPRHLSGKRIQGLGSPDLVCHNYITVHSKAALGLISLATVLLFVTVSCLCHRWRHQLLPCCTASSSKYVALYNVTDGEEDSITICTDSDYRRASIVKRKSQPGPVNV